MLLRLREKRGNAERERGKTCLILSSSYYRDIYTEQWTPRMKDTDKRKPARRGRKVGIALRAKRDLELSVVEV